MPFLLDFGHSFFYVNKVIDFISVSLFMYAFDCVFFSFFWGLSVLHLIFFFLIFFMDRAMVGFYMRSGRIFDLSASLAYSRLSNFCRIL
jgi:hypothetical protein